MAIDKSNALKEYKRGTSGAGNKLVENYIKTSGKLEAAASDSAQANYVEAMQDEAVLARRQNKLRNLSEEDLNKAMREKGASAYAKGTSSGAEKWLRNASPYLDEIDNIKQGLPPRGRDAEQNVINRVVPFAVGLAEKKKQMD